MIKDFPENLEIIKKSLVKIGFTQEEAESQILEVGKIVTMAILKRLLIERASVEDLTPQNIQKYLESNFNQTYLKQVLEFESNKIVDDYLKAVTKDLASDAKQNFYQDIQEN
jgi:hypothetical protein